MRSHEPKPLHRNRDFLLLWTGQTISVLGSRISTVAFPLLVLALTNSPARAGLTGFFGSLPFLLFFLPAGGFVDRWNRKRTMILCDIGRGLALGSVAIALVSGRLTFAQIVVVAFVEGTLFVFFLVAEGTALPHVVLEEQLPDALSRNEARSRGAALVGQPLGGLLFGLDRALPFLVDALSYAASVASLLFVRSEFQETRPGERTHLHREVAEGLAFVWKQPFLRVTSLLVTGTNMVFQALFLTVIVLAKSHGASPAEIGLVLGCLGGGGLLGALAAARLQRRLSATTIVIGANWIWFLGIPPMALLPKPLALGVIYGAMAFAGPVWNVIVDTYTLILTPDRLRGRVNSVILLIAWGAIPLGSLLAGVLLQAVGATATTLILAAVMGAVALAATVSPSVRHIPPLHAAKGGQTTPGSP